MKIRRNTGGYTLLELTMVVAILGILMGLSAIGIHRHQRTLTQVEYDGIAREIFIAAQNHLTMLESQGFLEVSDSEYGRQYYENGAPLPGVYYFIVDNEDITPDRAGALNILNLMLPTASVDGTVRLGGSYVICYQKDPARVLDVFYANAKSGRFHHQFNSADIDGSDWTSWEQWIMSLRGDSRYKLRQYYGDDHTVIGWYGLGASSGRLRNPDDPRDPGDIGDPNDLDNPDNPDNPQGPDPQPPPQKGKRLNAPIIKVVNAERLYVEVINPNTSEDVAKAGVRLVVEGEQSGKTHVIDLWRSQPKPTTTIPGRFPTTILDDVTSDRVHFYEVCPELFPGENIIVYAEAYNNQELTNIATSASVTTNSLFASMNELPDSLEVARPVAVQISNFRHLENLDSSISRINSNPAVSGRLEHNYYQLPASENGENPPLQIERIEQTSDMDWKSFRKAITGDENGSVVIYSDRGNSNSGHYLPVVNQREINYTGEITDNDGHIIGVHTISNVSVNASAEAGLFATLGHESTVSNLQLVNFDVTSTGGAAGALAGVLRDGSTVSGVLAHGKDSAVTGKTSVGGLIGEIEGTVTVKQSAAAVYVTSDSGDAGGLIGAVENGADATVTDSYAGGHTTNGNYDKEHCNITADAGKAGGLIGSGQGSLTVKNCYATTSVKGATAGGFVGSVTNGSITKCYATGYVTGTGNKGAFAGESSATLGNDGYFAVVNEEQNLSAVGTGSNTGVTNWDGFDGGGFDGYGAGKANSAKPYDEFLIDNYKGLYTFKTISEWPDGATSPEWMTTHYGDWPALDTLVINETA